MDANPLHAWDKLSKKAKIAVAVGGVSLGALLYYLDRKKSAAGAVTQDATPTDPTSTDTTADNSTDATGDNGYSDDLGGGGGGYFGGSGDGGVATGSTDTSGDDWSTILPELFPNGIYGVGAGSDNDGTTPDAVQPQAAPAATVTGGGAPTVNNATHTAPQKVVYSGGVRYVVNADGSKTISPTEAHPATVAAQKSAESPKDAKASTPAVNSGPASKAGIAADKAKDKPYVVSVVSYKGKKYDVYSDGARKLKT